MSGKEMRLIDANKLPDGKFVEPRTEWHQGWNDALDAAMSQAPTVDAVEVVRCFNCKKEGTEDCPMVHRDKYFGNLWSEANGTDFCSRGVRRDGADT